MSCGGDFLLLTLIRKMCQYFQKSFNTKSKVKTTQKKSYILYILYTNILCLIKKKIEMKINHT